MGITFILKLLIMRNIKNLTTIWIITLIWCISKVSAVTAFTLRKTRDTADHGRSQVEGSFTLQKMISLVNNYLWFAIWFCCFIFMIWNWYKLITAAWDDKAMGSARKALLWSWIWLIVSLLAYMIVNVTIRLFNYW